MRRFSQKRSLVVLLASFILFLCVENIYAKNEAKRIGLVLSGGGARGLAHIGVLKGLEELGVRPDLIIGTSMGAIVGGLYAAGKSPEEMVREIKRLRPEEIFSQAPFKEKQEASLKMGELPELFILRIDSRGNVLVPQSLLSIHTIVQRLLDWTVEADFACALNFDSLEIPFRAVATDILTGKQVVIDHGPLSRAIAGSSAYPFVMEPVRMDSALLVDGGVVNNVPVNVALDLGADFVIAVDIVSKVQELKRGINALDIINQTINLMAYASDTRYLDLADVVIHPDLGDISSIDFSKSDSLISLGYKAVMEKKALFKDIPFKKLIRDYQKVAREKISSENFGKVEFHGLKKTRDFIVRRELLFKEGDPWNKNALMESLKNLYSTDLFKDVFVAVFPDENGNVAVHFDVSENVHTYLSFGAYHDSEKETRAFIRIQHRNLFGFGLNSSVSAIFSDQYFNLSWKTTTNRVFTTPLIGDYVFSYNRYHLPVIMEEGERTFGDYANFIVNVNGGVQIRRIGLTSLGFKWVRNWAEPNQRIKPTPEQYEYSSLVARVYVDNTNRYDFPTRGRRNIVIYEQSIRGREISDVESFRRLHVLSRIYNQVTENLVINSHLRFGHLQRSISFYDKFFINGVEDLPGYHLYEKWANNVLSIGIDVRQKFREGVYAYSRFRIGSWWEPFKKIMHTRMSRGVSLGVMIETPIGPVNIDYGWNLANESSLSRSALYLSIGRTF